MGSDDQARIEVHFHGARTYERAHCWPGCRKWAMPCPACHHDEHDPGGCPECPRCELHVDEALIWAARVAREDYDEFVEGIEADAIKAAINDLAADEGGIVGMSDGRAVRLAGGYSWDCPNCGERITSWVKPPALAAAPQGEPGLDVLNGRLLTAWRETKDFLRDRLVTSGRSDVNINAVLRVMNGAFDDAVYDQGETP